MKTITLADLKQWVESKQPGERVGSSGNPFACLLARYATDVFGEAVFVHTSGRVEGLASGETLVQGSDELAIIVYEFDVLKGVQIPRERALKMLEGIA